MKYTIIKIKTFPLTQMMKKYKLSGRKLAKLAGIDYSYLYRLQQGKYTASEEVAKKIINTIEMFKEYN